MKHFKRVCYFAFLVVIAHGQWQLVKKGTVPGSMDTPDAVSFIDENTGWMLESLSGKSGWVIQTTDGGVHWDMIGDTANYKVDLHHLAAVNADLVYFSGEDGLLLITTNGGADFTASEETFLEQDLDGGIAFLNDNMGVVCSDGNGGHTWYTHDGGDSWNYVSLGALFPEGARFTRLYDIAAAADSIFAICGYHHTVFLSENGGKSYRLINTQFEFGYEYFESVAVLNQNSIYAGGTLGRIIKTVDGGNSWVTLETGSGQGIDFIEFFNSDTGIVFGGYGQWFKTTDGGSNWASLNSWPDINLLAIGWPADQRIIVSGWGGGEIAISDDGGYNWDYPRNTATNCSGSLNACEFIDADNGLIAGDNAYIGQTGNGGDTWTAIDNPMQAVSFGYFDALRYLNADIVYAGGKSGVILKSTDGGSNWTEIPNAGSKTVYGIWPFSETEIIAVAASGQVYLYDSVTDSFRLEDDYGSMSLKDVEFRNGVGIIPASKGYIFRTTTAELDTLYEVFQDTSENDLSDAEFVNDTLVYVVGDQGKIYRSADAGLSWKVENSPTEESLNRIRFRNGYLLAVGDGGTILLNQLYDPESIVYRDNSTLPKEYKLYQNYPNPFNPTTTISFDLPEAADVRVIVYNMVGQQVARLHDGPLAAGNYRITFSAAGLASGVYIYRVVCDHSTDVRKMTILK